MLALGCTTPEEEPGPAIKFLKPVAGTTFKMTETVPIVVESDFSQFTSGIIVDISLDSSKTWELLQSFAKREGIARDTINWVPGDEAPGALRTGAGVLFKARDYDNNYTVISDYLRMVE